MENLIEPILPEPGEEEIWKVCEDYPAYEVSSFGNVRNKKTQHVFKQNGKSTNGYFIVHLRSGVENKTGRYVYIHRLVGKAFAPMTEGMKLEIDHIDRNRENNYYKNIRWVSHEENNLNRKPRKEYHSKIWKNRTPIVLLDKNTGELIREYSCVNEASKELGLSPIGISNNILGLHKKYVVGQFKTKEDYLNEKNI